MPSDTSSCGSSPRKIIHLIVFIICFGLMLTSMAWTVLPHVFLGKCCTQSPSLWDVCCHINSTLSTTVVTAVTATVAADGSGTETSTLPQKNICIQDKCRITQWIAICIVIFLLVTCFIMVFGNRACWSQQFWANVKLLLYATFTKMPIDEIERPFTKNDDGTRRHLTLGHSSDEADNNRR